MVTLLSDLRFWIIAGVLLFLTVVVGHGAYSPKVLAKEPGALARNNTAILGTLALIIVSFAWLSWKAGLASLLLGLIGFGVGARAQERRFLRALADARGRGRTSSLHDLLPFPVWLEQKGCISVQDGLTSYLERLMSVAPPDSMDTQPRTVDAITSDVARQSAEVVLLEQCRAFYGAAPMSPEFDSLLSHKQLAVRMAEDLLAMKLRNQALIEEAMRRAAKPGASPDSLTSNT